MISRIVCVNPLAPAGYAPLLSGASPSAGTPLVLGYELDGAACGVLAADCFEDSVTLRWICVDRTCQHRGVGGSLFQILRTLAADAGARVIDAAVCACAEERSLAERFLTRYGFSPVETAPVYRFPLSAITQGPLAPAIAKADPRGVPLRTLPDYLLRELKQMATDAGGPVSSLMNPDALLPESLVWLEHGALTGCVLLAPCGSGVELQWLHAKGGTAVQGLLTGAARALSAAYPPQTMIHAAALVPSAAHLIEKLAGGQLTKQPPLIHFALDLVP